MKRILPSSAMSIREFFLIVARHIYELLTPRERDISPVYFNVRASKAKIPNRVYQTWETSLLPSLLAWEIRRIRRLNPDYSFSFFDADARAEYMERHYAGHPILQVFRDLKLRTAQVDVWRYCILYREGGVYCDIDSALSVPLHQVITEEMPELISFERNLWKEAFDPAYARRDMLMASPPAAARAMLDYPDNVMLNWMLCFEKEHPVLKETIDLIVRHFAFFQGKTVRERLESCDSLHRPPRADSGDMDVAGSEQSTSLSVWHRFQWKWYSHSPRSGKEAYRYYPALPRDAKCCYRMLRDRDITIRHFILVDDRGRVS